MVIDVDYRIAKAFLKIYNLVNLFTAQNCLELDPQLPRVYLPGIHNTKINFYVRNFLFALLILRVSPVFCSFLTYFQYLEKEMLRSPTRGHTLVNKTAYNFCARFRPRKQIMSLWLPQNQPHIISTTDTISSLYRHHIPWISVVADSPSTENDAVLQEMIP